MIIITLAKGQRSHIAVIRACFLHTYIVDLTFFFFFSFKSLQSRKFVIQLICLKAHEVMMYAVVPWRLRCRGCFCTARKKGVKIWETLFLSRISVIVDSALFFICGYTYRSWKHSPPRPDALMTYFFRQKNSSRRRTNIIIVVSFIFTARNCNEQVWPQHSSRKALESNISSLRLLPLQRIASMYCMYR